MVLHIMTVIIRDDVTSLLIIIQPTRHLYEAFITQVELSSCLNPGKINSCKLNVLYVLLSPVQELKSVQDLHVT